MMKIKKRLSGTFLSAILAVNLISAQSYGCPMFGWDNYSIAYWLLYLLVATLIITAIYWLIKSANKK